MEEKQQNIRYVMVSPVSVQSSGSNDEIDLAELWKAIWSAKWLIIAITSIFVFAAVFYALYLPNIYKSEALLAPVETEQQGGLAGLAGQFGGIASLAGLNLTGGAGDKTDLALEILKSREFFSMFNQKHNILPDLMAAKSWDMTINLVIYDEDLYLIQRDEWVRDVDPPKQIKPSIQESIKIFKDKLNIAVNKDTGIVTVSVEHYSPYVAKQWIEWLIEDINLHMKNRDKHEAEQNIAYLQTQIEKTTVSELKNLLYQLIEEQTKTLMFAEVREEYIFKIIDKAFVPEEKASPKRAIIVVLGFILGAILSVSFVLVRNFKN
ncbi:Wzz/FepE/Etk N-terminal domain-containing protein [Paraglaciecola sp.]|uniref:Wzz/FepE/Etk N-terminal domain-containing protein n=1 Tax=Paraglaciecola sp. TaxID=1920173 RepID=UPI00273D1F24|nr:Wzz/FepE/Etk N-terminal domain-containing protein [Paraglaciecola sp.]MDP5033264.1 Wzz/FepE/Etk N-terminal domain-containing protein [Paraglaciecola sp.]